MASIPASQTELTALGAVRVFSAPDPNAPLHLYADEDLPSSFRQYNAGEPLGKSLGVTVTGSDGAEYLKIESFYWKALLRILGIVVNKGREFRTSYVRLDERDQFWRVDLPGGVGTSEADAIDQFLRTYRESYMPLADWTGIPEPQKIEIFKNDKGESDFRLTFAGGKVVVWSTFKTATLGTKLNLLSLSPTGATLTTPTTGTNKTSDLSLYLAGGAVLLLMVVVIVFQYIRKRRNNG